MNLKLINVLRFVTLIILLTVLTVIYFMYEGFERRALLFEFSRTIVILHILTIEFFSFVRKDKRKFDNIWKKMMLSIMIGLSIFFSVLLVFNFTNLFADAFILGYRAEKVMVLEQSRQYRSSNKVKLKKEDGRIEYYSLSPGYTEVEVNKLYLVHTFQKSRIIIALQRN